MASDGTFCVACGEPIVENLTGDDRPAGNSCPKCGGTARRVEFSVSLAAGRATVSGELSVTTYPQILLATASDLFDRGEFGIAIVVAHMASEIATERAVSHAFAKKSVQYLEEPVLDFVNGYNLSTLRNRKLYTALTDDLIAEQPFWQAFIESANRRNGIMHRGKIASKAEAEASLSCVRALVTHLNQ